MNLKVYDLNFVLSFRVSDLRLDMDLNACDFKLNLKISDNVELG